MVQTDPLDYQRLRIGTRRSLLSCVFFPTGLKINFHQLWNAGGLAGLEWCSMWRGIGYWSKGPESTYCMLRWSRWLHTSSKNHTIHIIIVSSRLIWSHVYSNMYMTCIRALFTRFLCPSFPFFNHLRIPTAREISASWPNNELLDSRVASCCWTWHQVCMYARRQFVRCCKKAIGFRICIFPKETPMFNSPGLWILLQMYGKSCVFNVFCWELQIHWHAQRIWTLRKNPRVAVRVFLSLLIMWYLLQMSRIRYVFYDFGWESAMFSF